MPRHVEHDARSDPVISFWGQALKNGLKSTRIVRATRDHRGRADQEERAPSRRSAVLLHGPTCSAGNRNGI